MVHSPVDDVNTEGTLRHEVAIANNGDTIGFAADLHAIELTRGGLVIRKSLRFTTVPISDQASSNAQQIHPLTISISGGGRFMTVEENESETFDLSTKFEFSGFDGTDPNHPEFDGEGGAFLNFGTLTLNNCDLHDNTASLDGGAITNYGMLTLNNCTIEDNVAGNLGSPGAGGGISNTDSGTMVIDGGTISKNTAVGALVGGLGFGSLPRSVGGIGGGISNSGDFRLVGVTVSGNTAGVPPAVAAGFGTQAMGGGIFNDAAVTEFNITRGTVSDNSATLGGGICNLGTMLARFVTLSGNSAALGGGIYNQGTMLLGASDVYGNSAGLSGGGAYNAPVGTFAIAETDFSTDGGTRPPNTPDDVAGNYQDQGGNTFTI
jgi:hypothetical protein